MQSADLEVIKDIPGYKVILKAVLKSQIQQLVEQLADHTGEESVILTASVSDGSLSHLGSESGKVFLEDHDDIKSQFLGFCLKRYHKQKQQEKERQQQKSMVTTPPKYGQGPRPRFSHPQTSPRFQTSPRQPIPSPGVHPVSLTRASPQSAGRGLGSGGQRHQPYPAGRLPRASPNFEEGRGPSAVKKPGGPMRLPTDPNKTQKNNPNELIKIEALDEDEKGGDNAEKTTKDNTQAASVSGNTESSDNIADDSVSPSHSESSSHPSSPSRSTQSSVIKREPPEPSPAGDNNDDNLPHGELASDSSNNTGMSGDTIPAGLTKVTTEQASTVSSVSHSVSEQNIIIKTEADEADMDLEITGVEPGQMTPTSDSSWMPGVQNRMGFDPSVSGAGATAGQSEQGFVNGLRKNGKKQCGMCGKRMLSSSLSNHMRLHSSERFICTVCGKSFVQKSGYQCHMYTRHKIIAEN